MSHTCDVLDILSNAPMRSNCGLYRQNILYIQDMSSDRVNAEPFLRMTTCLHSLQIQFRFRSAPMKRTSHFVRTVQLIACDTVVLWMFALYIEVLLNIR